MSGYLFGGADVAFVTDEDGVVSLVPGIPILALAGAAAAALSLSPGLVSDADAFFAPNVVGPAQALSAGLVSDPDAFFAPSIRNQSEFLRPSAVVDDDAIFAATIPTPSQALLPSAVVDADAIYAAAVAASAQLLPSTVADADAIYAATVAALRTLLPSLVANDDALLAPAIATASVQALLPSRVVDADTIFGPTAGIGRFLRPSTVLDTEAVYPAYSIDTAKLPKEQRLRAGKLNSDDVIFAARFSLAPKLVADNEVIYAPILVHEYFLRPALLAGDDIAFAPFVAMEGQAALVVDHEAIYRPSLTLFLLPSLLEAEAADEIPAADVGWQIIAEFAADNDDIFPAEVFAHNDIAPETWFDEETIDTYPFFVQALTGGIPVPRPPGVLTGSLSEQRGLTGSLSQPRRLTGSLANKTRRVLTGSLRNVR